MKAGIEVDLPLDTAYRQQSLEQIGSIKSRYRESMERALATGTSGHWLDIGPNLGHGLSELWHKSFNVTAIDIKQDYLSTAIMRNPHARGVVMSGCEMGFPNEQFPCVSCFEVLEHLQGCNQPTLLQEIHRVLTPNGLLFLSTPNKIASGNRRMSPDHQKELDKSELVVLLEEQGFEIVDILGQGFFNQSLPHRLWRFARENPAFAWAYYHVLPWPIRSRMRDCSSQAFDGNVVRVSGPNETERIFFTVCRKKEKDATTLQPIL